MAKKNIRLDIEYDGTGFSGWQIQPEALTVQGEIKKAIKKVTGQEVVVYGAGRTDAGVHALGQVCNFFIDHGLAPERFCDAINFYLPRTILVLKSSEIPEDFDSRRSAIWRQYRYIIGRRKSALYFNHRWEYTEPLDMERMNNLAAYLIGKKNCSAFCTVSSLKENNECEIISAGWSEDEDSYYFDIKANRFLHSMVRSIVGLMIEAGRGKDYLTLKNFRDIMKSGDHTRIKKVAPARGLYLVAVGY
ncbi:MAG TPA: tRNA pseudouridine(38-40) synthase TruA [candidate division Zixibacteria bacterium]|nr:tRNA pseudouridine(38-40) synthase TruA [candidate division Zixibacteria bacterium]